MGLTPIELPDALISYDEHFLPADQADHLLAELEQTLAWRQDDIRMFGRTVKIPRLQAWYGDPEATYRYSGLDLSPLPWTDSLLRLREQIEAACPHQFNSVLANLYRSGTDSMGWHADDEPELGPNPVITSVTLGLQPRPFVLRHCQDKQLKYSLELAHGSLLVMAGSTQACWQHAVPKRPRLHLPRINLTFRYIHPRG